MGDTTTSLFVDAVNRAALTASLGGVSDYRDRLEGHIQEIAEEAVPWELNGHRIRDLELLRDEVHFRFPPDFFSPGRLESRDGLWDEGYDWFSDLAPELVRLLKAFRNVEREIQRQVDKLSGLDADDTPQQDFRDAFSSVAAALAPIFNELDASLSDIVSKINAAKRAG